jgi:glutathione S-transferase
MLKLYHSPRTRSSRIVWLLEEFGQPYEIEYVGIRGAGGRTEADPRNPHPDGKVPALDHDGRLVTESIAICLYLSDAFPEAGLGPLVGDPDRGDYLTWLAYYAGVIEPNVLAKATGWTDYNPTMAAWGSYDDMIRRLDGALIDRPYVLGDRFSTVDVLMGSALQFARGLVPDNPAYDAYATRMAARPALKRALEKDAPAGG